jgi:DNA-binding response OmpR family regulator
MSKPIVLVIDDDEPILLLMRRVLQQFHFEAMIASSGARAVEMARSHTPDVVLIDMKMPGMNGEETIGALRREAGLESVPIFILSGAPVERSEVRRIGAAGAISKPFDLVELVRRIREALPASAERPAD